MNNKGFTSALLILLGLIIAGTAGYFFYFKKPVQLIKMSSITSNTLSSGTPSLSEDHKSIVVDDKVVLAIDDDAIFNFFKTKSQLCDGSNLTSTPNRKMFCEDRATFKSLTRFTSIFPSPDNLKIGFMVESDTESPDKVAGIFYPFNATGKVNFLTSYYLGNEFISFSPNGTYFVYQGNCWEAMCGLFIKNSETLADEIDFNNPKEGVDARTVDAKFVRWVSDNEVEYKLGTELKQASVTSNPPAILKLNQPLILKVNLPAKLTSSITIMVPENEDAYKKAMTEFAQAGGPDPLKTMKFVKKELTVPFTTDLVMASAQAAAGEIAPSGGPAKASVSYLKMQNGMAYVLLDIDLDGWAGVSVSLAIIHPLVEKTLLQFSGIKSVVFGYAPEESASETWKNTPAEIKKLTMMEGIVSLSIDILTVNPNFLPGENDFFINQSTKLRDVRIDNNTAFYKCGAGPDGQDTTADVSSTTKDFIAVIQQKLEKKASPVIYYFDITNSLIKNIYEQCLP